jgi:hypothetical protein
MGCYPTVFHHRAPFGSRFGVQGSARRRRARVENREPGSDFTMKTQRGIAATKVAENLRRRLSESQAGTPVPPTDCTTETQRGVATKVVEAAKMAALQWQGGGARQAARQPQPGTRFTEARRQLRRPFGPQALYL